MKRYVFNDSQSPRFDGGVMIPPGEGRVVEAPDEPLPEAAAAEGSGGQDGEQEGDPPPAHLVEMLSHGVKDIVPEISTLTDEHLALLAQLEQDGQARKGVLGAIAELQLARAQQRAGGEPT